jgi:UDP-N-acetylmuramoylalanine--D-glutamate ligase
MYETLIAKGNEKVHSGLAGIDSSKLKKMRSAHLKACFNLIDEMRHKLEFVARIKGVSFIDDAASRTAMSTWYALETVEGKVVWIVNGASADIAKASEYKRLRTLVENKVKMIICLGDSELYTTTFGDVTQSIIRAASMAEAVTKAFYSSEENTKVLFSPSYENGISYEEQGESFKHEVNEL